MKRRFLLSAVALFALSVVATHCLGRMRSGLLRSPQVL